MIVDMQTGLSIPDSWCELLKQLQEQNPTTVLAGGAIRDLYCGRTPVNDLDFFANDEKGIPVFSQFYSDVTEKDYEGMEFVDAIIWYPKASPLPCNIICGSGYDSTMQLLESFDFGICQIAFDGLNIIKTWAFDWDFKHAVMTLRLTERHQGRRDLSLARFERWQSKYPDFSLVEKDT
jgi:hypothetical protein